MWYKAQGTTWRLINKNRPFGHQVHFVCSNLKQTHIIQMRIFGPNPTLALKSLLSFGFSRINNIINGGMCDRID